MTAPTPGESVLLAAAAAAAEVLADGEIADDIATSFSCDEVETLAEFLRAYGFGHHAGVWIESHAEGDDCGDQHCRCDDCTTGA